MRRLRREPMVVLAAIAIACGVACSFLPGPAAARVPFAMSLLLVLPGFALWSALMPRRRPDPLRTIAYSLGLSLVLGVVAGVEMGAYGALSSRSWSVLAATVTVIAGLIARARRPAAETRPAEVSLTRPDRPRGARIGAVACSVVALLVIGAAIGLARTPLPVPTDRGYTVMTVGASPGQSDSVTIGITSSEADTRRFRLKIRVSGQREETRAIVIAPGQAIEEHVTLAPPVFGRMTAVLVDDSSGVPQAYRRVRINVPVQPASLAVPSEFGR